MDTTLRPSVLVVDDDEGVRTVLGAFVERNGYTAHLAWGGDEGVRLYDRHRAEIAAVVLDVLMPEKDGPQTLTELRQRDPGLPCVFVTGYAGHYAEGELEGRGTLVLNKPVTSTDLGRALRTACRTD